MTRFREKCRAKRRNTLGQATDVKLSRRVVTFHQLADFVLQTRFLIVKLQQRARVNADQSG